MKRIKWFNLILVVIAVVAVVVWASNTPNSAQGKSDLAGQGYTCNANSVSGTYIYAAFGTIHPGNTWGLPPGPYNAAATSELHGDGTYELTSRTMYTGAPQAVTENFTGTFSIDENCGITFYVEDTPTVFTYGAPGHITVMGVSLIPGTNTTYLITRK
jgi:hypothetical protein